jgi:hypothetical protein
VGELVRGLHWTIVAMSIVACSPIEQKTELGRSAALGKAATAGVGDTVLDLRLRESLPNVFGKADIYGRTRDTGRVVVRFVGTQGDRANFVRQDILINSTETTMSRTPMVIPTSQQSVASGYIGSTPVSGVQTTTGVAYVPPAQASVTASDGGRLQLSAAAGGIISVEGRTITILQVGNGTVQYMIQ